VYRPDLGTYVMEAGVQALAGMIGLLVMPPYATPDDAGSFPVVPLEQMMKLEDVKRSPRGAYNRSSWEYEEGLYRCRERGHEEPVDDSEYKKLERRAPGMADTVTVNRALGIVLKAQEKRIADALFNESNFTAHAVGHAWDVAADGTPVTDIKDAKSAFRLQCGYLPDALVLAYETFQNITQTDEVREQLKYTFPGIDLNRINSTQLAAILNVPMVLIGGALYDNADQGQARSLTDIWNDEYAALVKISSGDDLREPGVGRTFIWDAESAEEPIVETYREDQIRSDVYRVRHTVDERLIQSVDEDGTVVSNIAAACVYLLGSIKSGESS
jgi:hypothetical protein